MPPRPAQCLGTPGTSTRSTATPWWTSPRSTSSASRPSTTAAPRSAWSVPGTRGSQATQTLSLAPGAEHLDIEVEVDWRERETILKLAWPLDVHTAEARFETQFGHVTRPIHENTTWDRYRFEVPALRWGARRRARLRHRHRQRPHLRVGRHPQRPRRWSDVHDGAGEPAAHARSSPTRTPTSAPTASVSASSPAPTSVVPSPRGAVAHPPRVASRAGPGGIPSPSFASRGRWSRRSNPPRTAVARWSCASTSTSPSCRSDLGPRAGRAPGPRPSARGRPARATPGHDRPAIGRSRPRRAGSLRLALGPFQILTVRISTKS